MTADRYLAMQGDPGTVAQERLKRLIVCAHFALHSTLFKTIMLPVVRRQDAAGKAAALLILPATMAQCLLRAKATIKDARVKFAVPGEQVLQGSVVWPLDAVCPAFGTSFKEPTKAEVRLTGLRAEVIYLA